MTHEGVPIVSCPIGDLLGERDATIAFLRRRLEKKEDEIQAAIDEERITHASLVKQLNDVITQLKEDKRQLQVQLNDLLGSSFRPCLIFDFICSQRPAKLKPLKSMLKPLKSMLKPLKSMLKPLKSMLKPLKSKIFEVQTPILLFFSHLVVSSYVDENSKQFKDLQDQIDGLIVESENRVDFVRLSAEHSTSKLRQDMKDHESATRAALGRATSAEERLQQLNVVTLRNILYMLQAVHGGVDRGVVRDAGITDSTFLTDFFAYKEAGVQSAHDLFDYRVSKQFQASRHHTEQLINKLLCDTEEDRRFARGLVKLLRDTYPDGALVFVQETSEAVKARYTLF